MIWLQSYLRFNELCAYNHESGSKSFKTFSNLESQTPRRTQGSFAFLSSTFFALYGFEGQLFLRAGEVCAPLANGLIVETTGRGKDRSISVSECNDELLSLNYSIEAGVTGTFDPTPFVDEESYDYGLFLSNISKSLERQKILLSGLN